MADGITDNTTVNPPRIIIDTNVLVAALRSSRGAAYRLVDLIDSGKFTIHVSVPLVLEYEEAATRVLQETTLSTVDLEDLIDYICSVAECHKVFYLWRPRLSDPDDEMILELAANARCEYIVTYNKKDFAGAEAFNLRVVTPREFLAEIGAEP
ncbi:MAG: putative toxin-antitoxin system toxin component, PIN family [Candidatus Hydrogenedentes bacterium]|nr:putative toxin-antitoxin system toxin component, PIN family [Candidatus Hydrogenedentota bacterium]